MGLPGMPGSDRNTRAKLAILAGDNSEVKRKRSKGFEYHVSILPPETQEALRLKEAAAATQQPLAPGVAVIRQPKKATHAVEIYQQCPALMESDVNELTQHQRDVADARCVVVQAVLRMEQAGCSRKAAINEFLRQQAAQELPASIQAAATLGNAKGRGTCYSTLRNWVLDYCRCNTPAERLAILAPKKRKPRKPEEIKWLPLFMTYYRRYSGLPITEAYQEFERDWCHRYANEPAMLAACPTYKTVCYQLKKLSILTKAKGRISGSDMRALEPYVARDWEALPVNYCWIGDGHSMKMKVAHPIHGRPFIPELTMVVDGRTRYLVGWSLALSENVLAVADALRFGIEKHGKPWMYYSDNGGGEKNQRLDADITGILPRMGIEHRTGIPGNAQGRGIIERINKTIGLKIARQFATYFGPTADDGETKKMLSSVESASKAIHNGKTLTQRQRKAAERLPSWQQLLDAIEAEIEHYNQRPHSQLPRKGNGERFTPAEYRQHVIESEGTQLEFLTGFELRDTFMPQVIRETKRGLVKFLGNTYFSQALAHEHGNKVIVQYDVHDASTVIIRNLEGAYLCDALWNGHARAAFPVSAAYHLHQQRVKGMTKRAETRIEAAQDEMRLTLPNHTERELPHAFRTIKPVALEPIEASYEEMEDIEVDEALERAMLMMEQRKAANGI
ncbi:Mu transposase C-terminal domain-containing protein [Shewanella algae]|uniref:Mu transposase C-terminal domain-containing protein n=1 Tax=Shewanella algae TaxID=38313 RepID=UPI0031F57F32